MLRQLPLIALALLLATIIPIGGSTEYCPSASPTPEEPDVSPIVLRIVSVDVQRDFKTSTPPPRAVVLVKVEASNQGYVKRQDVLLTLAIKNARGIEEAALSLLVYMPFNQTMHYTNILMVRSSGQMVVEASIQQRGKTLSPDRYYIDVRPFDLLA